MRVFYICLILAFLGPEVDAASLRVERDGSGDYSIIQDAVDAAASGDTILIGPGRFDEGQIVTVPGWSEYVRVLVEQEELTLIGAGMTQTIIGPEAPWDLSQGDNMGIEAGPWWSNQHLVVEGVGFENLGYGIRSIPAPVISVKNCRFSGNHYSIIMIGGGTVGIEECEFDLMPRDGGFVFSDGNPLVIIKNSTFKLDDEHFWLQRAVKLQRTFGEISDCKFQEGNIGLGLSAGSSVIINRCSFVGQELRGLSADGGSSFEMADCRFENQATAFFLSGIGETTINRTEISEVSEAVFTIDSGGGSFLIHDSILAHGPQYTVFQFSPCDKDSVELQHIDMTNNDWGTTSADSIESWISTCTFIVDYEPFVGQETPVKGESLGSFKSMFR